LEVVELAVDKERSMVGICGFTFTSTLTTGATSGAGLLDGVTLGDGLIDPLGEAEAVGDREDVEVGE
jgi:hypothetical protein